ncbi:2347_t:CDS:2, partial [Dentiscutata erythropus]
TVRKVLSHINIGLSEVSRNKYLNLVGSYNNDFILVYCNDIVTVGNIKQFEKIVEAYPQNTVGIIVTSQKRYSFNSSKRAKSSKSSARILFTSVNEMATDIPVYFLLRKNYQFNYQHKLIERFEKFEKKIIILLIFLLLMMGYSVR